jgi:hypothetical protein
MISGDPKQRPATARSGGNFSTNFDTPARGILTHHARVIRHHACDTAFDVPRPCYGTTPVIRPLTHHIPDTAGLGIWTHHIRDTACVGIFAKRAPPGRASLGHLPAVVGGKMWRLLAIVIHQQL